MQVKRGKLILVPTPIEEIGEIAAELKLTLGTVKQYNHSIYQKLQVANKTEAINKYFGR